MVRSKVDKSISTDVINCLHGERWDTAAPTSRVQTG